MYPGQHRQAAHTVPRGDYLGRLAQARAPAGASPSYFAGAASRNSSTGRQPAHLVAAGGLLSGGASSCAPGSGQGGVASSNSWDPYGAPSNSIGIAVQPLAAVDHMSAPRGQNGPTAVPKGRQVKDNFVNRVVDKAGPAVVRVGIEQKVETPDNSDILAFIFGAKPNGGKQPDRTVQGHGSGFCVDGANGVIITNAHVVQDADRVTVTFPGRGAPLEAEVLEVDEAIDVAVIRVKERPKNPLPSMQLGYSESCRTGDWAIVLGNPFGLQNTCTLGIISSLDRSTGETGFDWMRHPLLQTDAAVNQGNSGGPMLNENGEVVGMISMRAAFGEGIGFAIPTESIRSAMPSLLDKKKVPRAYIGLKMTATPSDPSRRQREGAFVEMVVPKSPAEKAGFEVGDMIVEIDSKRVRHFDEVQMFVRSAKAGGQATFKVKRGDTSVMLKVQPADICQLREIQAATKAASKAANSRSPQNRGGQHRIILMP